MRKILHELPPFAGAQKDARKRHFPVQAVRESAQDENRAFQPRGDPLETDDYVPYLLQTHEALQRSDKTHVRSTRRHEQIQMPVLR